MLFFGSRVRVLRHLGKSCNTCKGLVNEIYSPLDNGVVELLDAADRVDLQKGRKQGMLYGVWSGRVLRAPGPFIREATAMNG